MTPQANLLKWCCALILLYAPGCFAQSFKDLCTEFITGYNDLQIPAPSLDYRDNFSDITTVESLGVQEDFFRKISKEVNAFNSKSLKDSERLRYMQMKYEIGMNLERIALEKNWVTEGRIIPENGLHALSNYKEWYSYYVKHFTSVNIGPEAVFEMGKQEVAKVRNEIKKIQTSLGFPTETAMYAYLAKDTFYLHDKLKIRTAYAQIDKTVRANLSHLFLPHKVDGIDVEEWPDAGPNTPPGMYLHKRDNADQNDVFQYNFYGDKHNIRCMEWLYMHEGIPGHHLQYTVRRSMQTSVLQNQFFYFGNSEGWACYIEDHGKMLGLYQDPYMYLGKWEWDLVRSARLVMEVGIHYYGWSYDKAKEYWKENIKGQDEITDREIKRITNWAGQALCYKAGALTIQKIIDLKLKKGEDIKQAHELFLKYSDVPLQVLLDAVN